MTNEQLSQFIGKFVKCRHLGSEFKGKLCVSSLPGVWRLRMSLESNRMFRSRDIESCSLYSPIEVEIFEESYP